MTVSLSDLKAKRSAMEPGSYDVLGCSVCNPEYDIANCKTPVDAIGLAATHNAADTLVEIAEAAQAYIHAYDGDDGDILWNSEKVFRAALAKVSP